jgi:hypothetical protein
MARLKALRLAREATEPPAPAVVKKKAVAKVKKSDAKTPALGDWLAGQQKRRPPDLAFSFSSARCHHPRKRMIQYSTTVSSIDACA